MPTETVALHEAVTYGAASGLSSLTWLLIALPMAGAALLLLLGRRSNAWGHYLGTLTALGSFGLGVALLLDMMAKDTAEKIAADKAAGLLDDTEAGLRTAALRSVA